MQTLPAILFGGPPHSGKSVLAYHISRDLRERKIEHYLLRATPDGEGDWSYQAPPDLAQAIRRKGSFSPRWVERACRDLRERQLPFLVDAGGRPQSWQEEIFDHCTHAVLLSRDAASRDFWAELAARHHLIVIADLFSDLHGADVIASQVPALQGTICGLDRVAPRLGATFAALAARVAQLCEIDQAGLRRYHLAHAPVEIAVDLDRLAGTLGADPLAWQPTQLPQVLDYLPRDAPLALYGRGPVWLYAAIACRIWPADLYQFDPRLGWVQSPTIDFLPPDAAAPCQATLACADDHCKLSVHLLESYLDYAPRLSIAAPAIPRDRGLVLEGKMPMWLWTGLARACRELPWLATSSPQEGLVVIEGQMRQRRDLAEG